MSNLVKVLLIVGALGFLLLAVAVGLGVYWVRRHAPGMVEGAQRAMAEARAQAPTPRGQDESGPAKTTQAHATRTLPARARGAEAFEPVVRLSGGRRFETRSIEKRLRRNNFHVSADYPQLMGDTSRAARGFNRRASALALGEIKPYLADEPDPQKRKNPIWKDTEEYHHVTSEVVFASDELISVLFYVRGYSWGAGHGYHSPRTLNYDLARGRALKLADLFRPGSGYLRKVARLCAEDLSRQFGRDVGNDPAWGDGVKPRPDNFKSWLLTPWGLVIIFEEYQVAAYSEGEPKVLIPYESLREIIRPQSPLASLAPSD